MHLNKIIIFVCFIFIFTGCMKERLYVQSRYVDYENLASYHVGTPDPQKKNPNMGQRLIVYWSFPEEYFETDNLHILLKIRYRNREEEEIEVPLESTKGHFTYLLLNEDYIQKNGFLTYKAMIIGDGEILDEWRHQIWTDLLVLDKG